MDNDQLARKIVLLSSCSSSPEEFHEQVLKLLNQHRPYVHATIKDRFITNDHPSFGGVRLLGAEESGSDKAEGTCPPHVD